MDEVGFKYFKPIGRKFYVYNSVFRPKEVRVAAIVVIKDHSPRKSSAMSRGANGIIGAILAGVIGVLVAFAVSGSEKVDADIDVILTDGTILEIRTQDRAMIERLLPYALITDPRAKARKYRGV